MFDIRKVDLAKLNSMTKYPSIPTYHAMGDKGMLKHDVQVKFYGTVYVTEKIDGTNARIICCPDGSSIVGSREDLLWERRPYAVVLDKPIEEIAHWRDNGGQSFVTASSLRGDYAAALGVDVVPDVCEVDAAALPITHDEVLVFLRRLPETKCKLDAEAFGKPEGFVLRAADRSAIAKIRHEDYERTLRRTAKS